MKQIPKYDEFKSKGQKSLYSMVKSVHIIRKESHDISYATDEVGHICSLQLSAFSYIFMFLSMHFFALWLKQSRI